MSKVRRREGQPPPPPSSNEPVSRLLGETSLQIEQTKKLTKHYDAHYSRLTLLADALLQIFDAFKSKNWNKLKAHFSAIVETHLKSLYLSQDAVFSEQALYPLDQVAYHLMKHKLGE